jgi:hypothetical protein
VSLRTISCFCFGVKTPSMSFTFSNGIRGMIHKASPGSGTGVELKTHSFPGGTHNSQTWRSLNN